MDEKSPDAFRTISEAAEELDLPQHVLRFWESRFREIKPMKRGGGRRFYRRDDLDLLRGIKHLLYGEGYTIRGVQRILREQGIKFVQAVWEEGAEQPRRRASDDEIEDNAPLENIEEDGPAGLGSRIGALIGRDLNARPDHMLGRQEPPLAGAPLPRLSEGDRALHAVTSPAVRPIPAPARVAANPLAQGLDGEQLRVLRGVLDDLRECRRMIDDVIGRAE